MNKPFKTVLASAALVFTVGTLAASGEEETTTKKSDTTETSAEAGGDAEDTGASGTKSQENARRSAEDYIEMMGGFSYEGLIEQLETGDSYTREDATWAVDNIEVDWNEQATISADRYLEIGGFSRDGLIEQLKTGDQFTQEQAEFAADTAGL